MSNTKLPALPEIKTSVGEYHVEDMREYARAAILADRERQAGEAVACASLRKPLQLAADALQDLIAAGQMAKDRLDSDIPIGEPVHPVSRRLTWPLSTALLAEKEARHALASLPAPQAVQADDVDRLLHEVLLLCEATEEAPEAEPKNEHQRGFERGRRFEAKSIRKAIGAWFQDEFCGRSFMGEPLTSMKPEWRDMMVGAHEKLTAAAPSPDGKAERMDGVRAFIRADAELARGGKAEQAEAPMNETLKTMIADMNGEIEG